MARYRRRRKPRSSRTETFPADYELVKPTAIEIRSVVTKYFTDKLMCVNHELGLCRGGRFRADVMALSMNGYISIVEVKSSVADFTSDKKWHNYVQYANQFYFAMDAAVYRKLLAKDRIPADVGIILVKVYKKGDLLMATRMKIVQRAPKREVDPAVQLNIAIRSAFRSSEFNAYKRRRKNI